MKPIFPSFKTIFRFPLQPLFSYTIVSLLLIWTGISYVTGHNQPLEETSRTQSYAYSSRTDYMVNGWTKEKVYVQFYLYNASKYITSYEDTRQYGDAIARQFEASMNNFGEHTIDNEAQTIYQFKAYYHIIYKQMTPGQVKNCIYLELHDAPITREGGGGNLSQNTQAAYINVPIYYEMENGLTSYRGRITGPRPIESIQRSGAHELAHAGQLHHPWDDHSVMSHTFYQAENELQHGTNETLAQSIVKNNLMNSAENPNLFLMNLGGKYITHGQRAKIVASIKEDTQTFSPRPVSHSW